MHLSCAVQVLAGELPTRDFADPGMPLMYFVSAAAQWLGGRTLLAEAVLVYGALALGAALVARAVADLTGSTLLGLWAGASTAIIGPRTYGYPKIVLYAAAVYLFVRAARTPSRLTAVLLAILTAVAFLFRHDHGVFIGAAAAAFILTAGQEGIRDRVRRLSLYVAVSAAASAPYVVYVQVHGGVAAYVRSATAFARQESVRTNLRSWTPPVLAADQRAAAAAALFYAFWALPLAAAAVAIRTRRTRPETAAAAGATCVLAIAMNSGFLRDRIEDRIADAVVPAVTLAAWLASSVVQGRSSLPLRALATSAAAAALLLFSIAAARVGLLSEQVARSELLRGPAAAAARWRQVTSELRAPRAGPQMPSAVALALMPFFEYAAACTRPHDAIFVPGFAPEAPYFSRRRFAGGHVTLVGGYYRSEEEQRRTLTILERQSVPLVVLPPGARGVLEQFHPRVASWLHEYAPLATYTDHQGRTTEVLVRGRLPAPRAHGPTGFPCFR